MNWALPNPPTIEDRLGADGSSLREQLEDVEMELVALAWRTAAEMNVVNPVAGEGWHPAQRDLERILGMQGCKSIPFSFRTSGLTLSFKRLLLFASCCTCPAPNRH
jgi:hypothetical protein